MLLGRGRGDLRGKPAIERFIPDLLRGAPIAVGSPRQRPDGWSETDWVTPGSAVARHQRTADRSEVVAHALRAGDLDPVGEPPEQGEPVGSAHRLGRERSALPVDLVGDLAPALGEVESPGRRTSTTSTPSPSPSQFRYPTAPGPSNPSSRGTGGIRSTDPDSKPLSHSHSGQRRAIADLLAGRHWTRRSSTDRVHSSPRAAASGRCGGSDPRTGR